MRSICVIWRIGGTLVIVRKRNEYARRYRSEHLAQARASARKYAAAHQREMAEYHRRWRSEHPEKYAQYEAKRKRKRQLAKEAVNE